MEIEKLNLLKGKHKSFHHGGRLGDAIFALYTVRKLGGGVFFLSDFHKGNWDEALARSLMPLIEYQDYVKQAFFVNWPVIKKAIETAIPNPIDYDLHEAEDDYNPQDFPEWNRKNWPGNINIVKRYALHFDVLYSPEEKWLTAPQIDNAADIVFHAPVRRIVGDQNYFKQVIEVLTTAGRRVLVIGNDKDVQDWDDHAPGATFKTPKTMLWAATYINSAKVFLGAVSSCNAIAEGLKKERWVQVAEDCDNIYPFGKSGHMINAQSPAEVAQSILKYLTEIEEAKKNR